MTTDAFAQRIVAAIEAAEAHKALAIQHGFSEEAAEAMAVTLHSVLMADIYNEVDNPPEE